MVRFKLNLIRQIFALLQFVLSFRHGQGFSADKTICMACHVTQLGTPFYCAVKPDLPHCITPICPQICEVVGEDLEQSSRVNNVSIPYASKAPLLFSLPPYLPKAGKEYLQRPLTSEEESLSHMASFGRGMDEMENEDGTEDEQPQHFDKETCELNSPYLSTLFPNSKYIEYRPKNAKKSYSDLKLMAESYGLVLAEIRRPSEEHTIESRILQAVSNYDENQPRIYYAYALSDAKMSKSKNESGKGRSRRNTTKVLANHGAFNYFTDAMNITFAVVDPRQYGRTDQQCGVMTSIIASDKRSHLITKMRNCDEKMEHNERLYGLLMFPPDSICYRRSSEECKLKELYDKGGEHALYNMIQIGQTHQRFIYFYSDQRTWEEARGFCEAMGLFLLDLDTKYDDAIRTSFVVEHFLRETKLNPITMFWTAGKFEKNFTEANSFQWVTTNQKVNKMKPRPFEFDWWDNQKEFNEKFQKEPSIPRRNNIHGPCVALALNPDDGTERPKINFKAWYCDFPSYFMCYKEINATDNIGPEPMDSTNQGLTRPQPSEDACDPLPEAPQNSSGAGKPPIGPGGSKPPGPPGGPGGSQPSGPPGGTGGSQPPGGPGGSKPPGPPGGPGGSQPSGPPGGPGGFQPPGGPGGSQPSGPPGGPGGSQPSGPPGGTGGSQPPGGPGSSQGPPVSPGGTEGSHSSTQRPPSTEHPFNTETCTSKSTTAKRLSPTSKYVDYRPKIHTYTVEEIKDKCRELDLIPAEITTMEDWKSITGSGIGGVLGGESETKSYFYVIGIDDKNELGKLLYTELGDPVNFTMFYSEGNTDINYRCVILDSVPSPDGLTRGLMMHHADCDEGASENRVAYGLCQFPRDSKCFKTSSEEKAAKADRHKESTLIPIGLSGNRSIFWNPKQRRWAEAKKFCEAANLSLLDLDRAKWNDAKDVLKLFKEKIAHDADLFQLTPLWTSGRIQGKYQTTGESGKWDSSGNPINFQPGGNVEWLRYRWSNLTSMREGSVQDGCIEVSFDDVRETARLKPGFCSTPMYFLCYRKNRKRKTPPGQNGLGIYIIDVGDLEDELEEPGDSELPNRGGPVPRSHMNLDNQFSEDGHSDETEEEEEGRSGDDDYEVEENETETNGTVKGESEDNEDDVETLGGPGDEDGAGNTTQGRSNIGEPPVKIDIRKKRRTR